MADENRGVVYEGPGKVEVKDIDLPELRAQGGSRRSAGERRARVPSRRHPADRLDEHLRLGPAHGPRTHHRAARSDPRARDHRRGDREGSRRRVPARGRPRVGPVQHRVRPLPELQGAQDGSLPDDEPGAPGRGVRLRGHGRLAGRPSSVRHGAVRRLQLPALPGQGSGDGEDPRPDDALGHLPDWLSRLRDRRRHDGKHCLRRRRGPGRPCRGAFRAAARRRGRDRRAISSPSGSSRRAASGARSSTSPRAIPRTRSRRCWARSARSPSTRHARSRRSTRASTPSASKPAGTANMRPRRFRPPS